MNPVSYGPSWSERNQIAGLLTRAQAMKKHVKTLYVVVDALRYDYIKDDQMPFLHALASKSCYVKRLVPSPGLRPREILTGKENIETGYFTAIDRAFAERTTPFALRLLEYLRLVFEFLERNLGVYLLFG